MDTVPGDTFISDCARFIRFNENKLGNVVASGGSWLSPTSWLALPGSYKPTPENNTRRPSAIQQRPLPLRITSHHLYYILIRCEGLGLPIGGLDVRIPSASRPVSYFAFISNRSAGGGRRKQSEREETMSVTSLQTTMSSLGLGATNSSSWWSSSKPDVTTEVKFIYSAMTKIPAVRIIPPPLKLIQDFEDCPGDMSIPMDVFKNVQLLEFEDTDPRAFIGWDRLSLQLRSLSFRRSGVEDISDLIIDAVIRDAKRRRGEKVESGKRKVHAPSDIQENHSADPESHSNLHSQEDNGANPFSSNKPDSQETLRTLVPLSWHFLRHLCLSDNSLTFVHSTPLSCITSLTSLDLSNNLLNAVPPSLDLLPNLRFLNVSNNLIESVLGIPSALLSIEALNLSHNRLESLCGLERLSTLKRVDVRHNQVFEAGEVGRLAILDHIVEVYIQGNPLEDEVDDPRVAVLTEFAREGLDIDNLKLDGVSVGFFERQRVRDRVPNWDRLAQSRAKPHSDKSDNSATTAGRRAADGQHTKSLPTVKNVRHRGPAHRRHGDDHAPEPTTSRLSTSQRRNRRVVQLHDGEQEGPQESKLNAKEEPSDSDAIKQAALQGNVDVAIGEHDAKATSIAPDKFPASTDRPKKQDESPRDPPRSPGKRDTKSTSHPPTTTVSGDELRRKIEALKGEVGDDWMRLLARGESIYVANDDTQSP